MKNNDITELVFILDRSGSMSGLEGDTVGGFNALIDKQKRQEGRCWVTTVLFDTSFTRLHDRLPLEQVAPLTREDYAPGGCTALLDAVGDTVEHIAQIHKYARPEDVPAQTVVVITTDGMENASTRYDNAKVKALVSRQQEKGWQFLFLGANIDAFASAAVLGIAPDHAANFHADSAGMACTFGAMAEAVSCARASRPLGKAWKKSLERDFQSRRK